MSRRALKQLKLLEQSLNNIGFIYNRQSLLFATGVLHKARRQLGRQPSCSGGVLECPSHHRHKGPFFTWGCFGETHFRLLSIREWSHEWISVLGKAHANPVSMPTKTSLGCLIGNALSRVQVHRDILTKTVSYTMKTVFLWPLFKRWEDVKNHKFPIIHLLSNYGLQSLKSPENNFF